MLNIITTQSHSQSLSLDELTALVAEASYIIELTIIESIDQDVASFEGGDDWIFDQYTISVDQQLVPSSGDSPWADNTLSMPGRKSPQDHSGYLKTGECYLAFYNYSAMAKGYSLEGLIKRSDSGVVKINSLINK